MNRKLHVTNLSPTTSPRELRELFGQAGHVAAITVVHDGITDPETGAAYVDMQSHDGAEAAVERFNQYRLQDWTLNVTALRPDAVERGDQPGSPAATAVANPAKARFHLLTLKRGNGDVVMRRSNDMLDEGGPLRAGD